MKIILAVLTILFLGFAALSPAIAHRVSVADRVTHTTASCTSSTGAALAANLNRRAALLVNDGTSSIWIRIGEASVANEGILLTANGGSYYTSYQDANFGTGAFNCITASATVVLLVVEWDNT